LTAVFCVLLLHTRPEPAAPRTFQRASRLRQKVFWWWWRRAHEFFKG
jgi:hypothetical protein